MIIGQHVFRAAPAPVVFRTTRHVQSSLSPEAEHVLYRSDRQRSHSRLRQTYQLPGNIVASTPRSLQVIPQVFPLVIREFFNPAARRGIVRSTGVYHRIVDVVVREVWVI